MSTRLAATESLKAFLTIINDEAWIDKKGLLRVYLALYDRLIDDDEDIREIGAGLVSKLVVEPIQHRVISNHSRSFSVPAARLELLQILLHAHKHSIVLWLEAVRRLVTARDIPRRNGETVDLPLTGLAITGEDAKSLHQDGFIWFTPASEILEQAMTPDRALFVEEKQNLYIDEVQEAKAWSQMLLDLQPCSKMFHVSDPFRKWTMDGLTALAHVATRDISGPLGWTSKPAVFTVGMQVILAAKVILCCKIEAISLEERELCKERLQGLLEVALGNHLHELWIIEMQDILEAFDSFNLDIVLLLQRE